jgi:hypothetical protein
LTNLKKPVRFDGDGGRDEEILVSTTSLGAEDAFI